MPGITLKKLAELSGVSIRTVNRVLKEQGDVSSANRELVKSLARKYNYIPNIAARNFKLQKKNSVGILMNSHLRNEAHLKKTADLERALIAAGYYPLIGGRKYRDPLLILQDWMGAVDCVVSFFLPERPEERAQLKFYPYNYIFIDCENAVADFNSIDTDRATGIGEAFDALISRNCRKILHCGYMPGRIKSVSECTASRSRLADFGFLRSGGHEFEHGYSSGPQVMASGADAVFFDTDRMAAGFYRYAWEHHVRIPEDISVVGFDDDSASVMLTPPLSTVAHPIDAISAAVLRIVTERPREPRHLVFDSHFVDRQSIVTRRVVM